MRRALVLSALPTAGMAAFLMLKPEHIAQAPLYLAVCAGVSLGLAFCAHLARGGRD